MTMKIVWLNGPPRSGKDTVGQALADYYEREFGKDCYVTKLAAPIKRAVKAFLGMDNVEWFHMDTLGKGKDSSSASPITYGRSLRECQIALAETFAKPLWGDQIFGKMLRDKVKNLPSKNVMVFVTDAGFAEECEPLIAWSGFENNALIRLSRDGTDYSKDSRSDIDLTYLGVPPIPVANNWSIPEVCKSIHYALKEIKKWEL